MDAVQRTVADPAEAERGMPAWAVRWMLPVPWLLIAAAVLLEWATPAAYSYLTLMAAATPLAALVYRPLPTALVAIASLGAMTALELWLGSGFSRHFAVDLATTVVLAVTAVTFAFTRQRAVRLLHRVRAAGEAAQLALLRPLPGRLGPVRLAGCYRAADAHALVGGDLYAVVETPWGVRAVVGDVRGKGNGAVATVATVLSTFREAAQVQPTLALVAGRIDRALAVDQADLGDGELFATALLLEFSGVGDTVRVLNRGHVPPLLLDGSGARPLDTPFALPLGLAELAPLSPGAEAEGEPEAECTLPLTAGQILLAFTDGVTEARGRDGSFYPLTERLSAQRPASPAAAVAFVERDVADWTPHTRDDLVVLALQRTAD